MHRSALESEMNGRQVCENSRFPVERIELPESMLKPEGRDTLETPHGFLHDFLCVVPYSRHPHPTASN